MVPTKSPIMPIHTVVIALLNVSHGADAGIRGLTQVKVSGNYEIYQLMYYGLPSET